MSDEGTEEGKGPVPVRDLMRGTSADDEPPGEPRWEGDGREFEMEGESWSARPAGAGAYGTGRLGSARLLAIHFVRTREPERPVREALLPAGEFPTLREPELRTLFHRATVIDVES
jgi:hypothetical protein